ncbi:hypothetical protein G7Y79_00002g006400 [Physcia stellaris]|nr:hypothetical protein G7Y79_00002g006400 [Physcia stellaris]
MHPSLPTILILITSATTAPLSPPPFPFLHLPSHLSSPQNLTGPSPVIPPYYFRFGAPSSPLNAQNAALCIQGLRRQLEQEARSRGLYSGMTAQRYQRGDVEFQIAPVSSQMSWHLAIIMIDAFMLKERRVGWKAIRGVFVYERLGEEDLIYGEGTLRAVEEGRVGNEGGWSNYSGIDGIQNNPSPHDLRL